MLRPFLTVFAQRICDGDQLSGDGGYPGAVCFYAASYGAMAEGNWPLFKHLVEGRLTHSGSDENVLEHLAVITVVSSEAANALHPQKRYTPISDHFHGPLRQTFQSRGHTKRV